MTKLNLISSAVLGFLVVYAPLQAFGQTQANDIPDTSITSDFPADFNHKPAKPKPGNQIRKYAIDDPGVGATNFGVAPLDDNMLFAAVMADRLEYQNYEDEEIFLWDVTAWYGGNYNKIYFESEGEHLIEGKTESADVALLYSRNVATFWDVQAGLRYDIRPSPERFFAVLGIEGLAPQWFEIESNIYLSEEAEVSFDLEAEYDLLITQRLILQPRAELTAAVEKNEEYGIGAGLNQFEIGARLRYEFRRKFAPYIGVSWSRKVGETANLAEREGEEESKLYLLAGVKLWF